MAVHEKREKQNKKLGAYKIWITTDPEETFTFENCYVIVATYSCGSVVRLYRGNTDEYDDVLIAAFNSWERLERSEETK